MAGRISRPAAGTFISPDVAARGQPSAREILGSPALLLGLGFGSGLAPRAPGTFGTLAAVPVCLLLSIPDSTWVYILGTAIAALAGIPICSESSRRLGLADHPAIVWDEIAGYLVTLVLVPVTLSNLVLGFILFRLFDIWKPWPIRLIDRRVHGGLGIMLDDLLAGACAAVILFLVNFSGLY